MSRADRIGRRARTPAAIPLAGWRDVAIRTLVRLRDDRILETAAGTGFFIVLAVSPALAAFVSLYGLFADRSQALDHVQALRAILPPDVLGLVRQEVLRLTSRPPEALGLAFLTSLGLSLWSANAAMKALFDGLNVVYREREARGFVRLTLRSLGFTAGALLVLVVMAGTAVVAPIVLDWLGLGTARNWVRGLRWPLVLVLITLGLSALYHWGPSRTPPRWHWLTVGSSLGTLLWLAVTVAFGWYVAAFDSYNKTYGSLGVAMGFLTWAWLTSLAILIGGLVNAELEHQTARDTTIGPDKPMGQRGAVMADTIPTGAQADVQPEPASRAAAAGPTG